MDTLFNLFQPQLELVRQNLNGEIATCKYHFPDFNWPILNETDRNFLPALILLSSRAQGYTGPRAVNLATVMQLIFLASLTHYNIKGQPASGILLGDYFYTCSFKILCRGGNSEFVGSFAELVCDINLEAAELLKKETPNAKNPIGLNLMEQLNTKKYLAAAATDLGSQLGRPNPMEAIIWQEIGCFLGDLWNKDKITAGTIRDLEKNAPAIIKKTLTDIILKLSLQQPFKRAIAL